MKKIIASIIIGLLLVTNIGCGKATEKNKTTVKVENERTGKKDKITFFNELKFVKAYTGNNLIEPCELIEDPDGMKNKTYDYNGCVTSIDSENGSVQTVSIVDTTGEYHIQCTYDRKDCISDGNRLVEGDEIEFVYKFTGLDQNGQIQGKIVAVEQTERAEAAQRIVLEYANAKKKIDGLQFITEGDQYILPNDNYGLEFKSYYKDKVVDKRIVYGRFMRLAYKYPDPSVSIQDGYIFNSIGGDQYTYDSHETEEFLNSDNKDNTNDNINSDDLREIGRYLGQGFAQGVDEYYNKYNNAENNEDNDEDYDDEDYDDEDYDDGDDEDYDDEDY